MKKILIILMLLVSGTSFHSCKKFLHVVPTDAMFLGDMQAIKQTLAAYLLNFKDNSKYAGTDAPWPWMNTQYSLNMIAYGDVWAFTTWGARSAVLTATEKRILDRANLSMGGWDIHYSIAAVTSLVISESETATGTEEMRNYVCGEARVHRAYSFFKLLQYFAPVNDPSLGIPLSIDVHSNYLEADLARKPQSAVYKLIIDDLLEAERLLGKTVPRKSYNIAYSYDFVYRILSQVYHWRASTAAAEPDDWKKAAQYAQMAIDNADGALPFDLDALKVRCHTGYSKDATPEFYPEAVCYFATGNPNYYSNVVWNYSLDIWKELYSENDLRKRAWFLNAANQTKPTEDITQGDITLITTKITPDGAVRNPVALFRLAEQYLIRIEALAHTDFGQALGALKVWQSLRYDATKGALFTPANGDELVQWIYKERKREFILEGDILWLDMKRFGISEVRPECQGFEYTLAADDWRYQFFIPASETDKNKNIIRNPGWDNLGNY